MTKNNLKIVKSGKNQEAEAKEKNKILNKKEIIYINFFILEIKLINLRYT